MARLATHTLLALGLLLCCAFGPALGQAPDACASLFGVPKMSNFSVIMNADPGTFSGVPEGHYFLSNLVNVTEVPTNKSVCGKIVKGSLMGQDVAVVLTGIGPTAAGFCTLDFVTACGPYITELIYSGTSGWSPQVGGTFPDPPNCDSANPNTNITRVGDLCVSPLAVNWVCKQASWTQQSGGYPNQCTRPKENFGPESPFLFGQCLFSNPENLEANLKLSLDLMLAMAVGVQNFPARSAQVAANETEYWRITSSYTNITYPYNASEPVTVWGFDECMEIDGQFFYSGAPWDVTARDYVADFMSVVFNTTVKGSEVIAVSAMEAIGVAEALEKYHSLATTTRYIPYTNVRGMSNWLNKPVMKTAPGVWGQESEFDMPFSIGYGYAIATYSAGIMSFYQQRCQAGVKAGSLPAATNCTFSVPYP